MEQSSPTLTQHNAVCKMARIFKFHSDIASVIDNKDRSFITPSLLPCPAHNRCLVCSVCIHIHMYVYVYAYIRACVHIFISSDNGKIS